MSNQELIVSLDLGTKNTRVIIGEVSNGTLNIVGVGSAESLGMKKGSIVDIDQTVESIRQAINHAERMVGVQIEEVYVGVSGNHIALQTNQGVVAVSNEDREIGYEDIDRVMDAAKIVTLPPEREIIDVMARQFIVDGLEEIQDPRGMIGVRLEVEATVVTGAKTAIHNIERCVEKAELRLAGKILMPLSAGETVLTKDEKMMGTALVDIGAGITTIAIYDQGHLVHTTSLPVGGESITNDIAYGFKTQTDFAEKLKVKYGCALVTDAAKDLLFKIPNRMNSKEQPDKEYTQIDLAEMIEPRVEEIFQLIRQETTRLGYRELTGGYVLTGGTVQMPGVIQLAQEVLHSPVRVAVPDYIGVRDPAFTGGVSIINYVQKNARGRAVGSARVASRKSGVSRSGNWSEKLKAFFSDFI